MTDDLPEKERMLAYLSIRIVETNPISLICTMGYLIKERTKRYDYSGQYKTRFEGNGISFL